MTDLITSLQNTRVKLAHQLQTRPRSRRKERKIALEGTRLISDALQQRHRPEFVLYDPAQADYDLIAQLQATRTTLIAASESVMQHVSDTNNPQGLVAVFPLPMPQMPKDAHHILILDAIREPGNLGTILRTAGAAGVNVVLLGAGCVDPYNPKVLRAGMGAHFRLPIIEATWPQIASYTQTHAVYLASGDGEVVYSDVDWRQAWALVIGNEAHGIDESRRQLRGRTITIPMASAESLNAAVATGVILFEAQRQRLTP